MVATDPNTVWNSRTILLYVCGRNRLVPEPRGIADLSRSVLETLVDFCFEARYIPNVIPLLSVLSIADQAKIDPLALRSSLAELEEIGLIEVVGPRIKPKPQFLLRFRTSRPSM